MNSGLNLGTFQSRISLHNENVYQVLLLIFTCVPVFVMCFIVPIMLLLERYRKERERINIKRITANADHIKLLDTALFPHRARFLNDAILITVDRVCKALQLPFILLCFINTGNALQWLNSVSSQGCSDSWTSTNVLS